VSPGSEAEKHKLSQATSHKPQATSHKPQATSGGGPHRADRRPPRSEESATALANHEAANNMDRKKPARVIASHVVEAELEHLEWATRQPALRTLDSGYWRRRVLAVKGGFELTEQRVMQLEKILQRLGKPVT
jgi:hypothetical protein